MSTGMEISHDHARTKDTVAFDLVTTGAAERAMTSTTGADVVKASFSGCVSRVAVVVSPSISRWRTASVALSSPGLGIPYNHALAEFVKLTAQRLQDLG